MENKPDTTVPGIDKQGQGFLRKPSHETEKDKEALMQSQVEKDRDFYESPQNPGKDFNINDQAHSQSSQKDFVKTTSKFHHADDSVENLDPEK
ncbi:MAG: hypothetical protein EOO01_10415 [Chitinophagaceae bacterium]|nr:MAG: hypothetical protein EOO01_10415 [Chitinophagaceae bacterium]